MYQGLKLRWELEGKRPWSKYVIMEALSKKYGWTPEQIRNMDSQDVLQYLIIILEKYKIEKIKNLKG